MELKKGMYVRTKKGIGRVTECTKHESWGYIVKVLGQYSCYAHTSNGELSDVIKASNNLIDLIEENDLLEIIYLIKSNEYQKELLQVIKNYAGKLYVNAFPKKIFIEDFGRYGVEILSVLTKEQFESQKYIVESE